MKPFALIASLGLAFVLTLGCDSSEGTTVPDADAPAPDGANGLSPAELQAIEAAQAAAGGDAEL